MDILWLDQNDVRTLLDMPSAMDAVESAFAQHGRKMVQMPPKSYLYFDSHNGDLRTMPACLEDEDIAGVKIVNVHPDNHNVGLPTVMALVVLNSTTTGAPIALMDGTYLTAIRTGAAGGLAAKYLARPDSHIVGMVGCGTQAHTQLLALSHVFDIEIVKVYSHNKEHSYSFSKRMEEIIGCDIVVKDTPEEVCECDILVTTTPVRNPLVRSEWIRPGTHINAIGADAKGKEELDVNILRKGKIVVDDIAQASHSGEVNVPFSKGLISEKDIHCMLGEVIAGIKTGRNEPDDITIFDSTGLAIQDVATAYMIYRKALHGGIGKRLDLF
ncbi:MAG: alanine dehydrogenase [Methanosarcinaceae archaeon]|nr:alanine dehydrogenase [Methanosarcinaceae archaeon]